MNRCPDQRCPLLLVGTADGSNAGRGLVVR